MSFLDSCDFSGLYQNFSAPLSELDCGIKCAPYNEYGVPFCCDTRHAIPTAYSQEWRYLQENTDLWHLWEAEDPDETNRLRVETPAEQVLIECLGHEFCQREFRSITCRAFPFFPYITPGKEFVGLSYYWQYEERCWVINHLHRVTSAYRNQFISAYENLFRSYPTELENFYYHSKIMRQVFGRQKRPIPLLHLDGQDYLVDTKRGSLQKTYFTKLPKHEPFKTAAEMPFPDELNF